jgi:hypothetical protein
MGQGVNVPAGTVRKKTRRGTGVVYIQMNRVTKQAMDVHLQCTASTWPPEGSLSSLDHMEKKKGPGSCTPRRHAAGGVLHDGTTVSRGLAVPTDYYV